MKEKQSQFPEIEFGNLERSIVGHNSFNGVNVKFTGINNSNVHDNSFSNDAPQLLVELRQRVAAIEEEGTRSQALATIDEMEKTAGSSEYRQHAQKLLELAKDYAEAFGPFIDLVGKLIA